MSKFVEPINELNKFLNSWLKENGFQCTARYSSDFSYVEGIIRWSLLFPEKSEKYFNDYLRSCGLKYDCDPFITAFFHELGHFETEDVHSQRVWDSYDEMCQKHSQMESLTKRQYLQYYKHPIEKEATMWAVQYINSNPKLVRKFWKEVKKKIWDIYSYFSYKVDQE